MSIVDLELDARLDLDDYLVLDIVLFFFFFFFFLFLNSFV